MQVNANAAVANQGNEPAHVKANSAASLKNEFMTLMIAQVKNQDPTKPMDSAQYVTQLAQFSQVESLEGMRKNQSAQMVAMENLGIVQSASLIGKTATVPASEVELSDQVINGKVFLAHAAEDLTIELVNQQGQVVDTVQLGGQSPGDVSFSVDPAAKGLAQGKYELRVKAQTGDAVNTAPLYVDARIDKIHFSSASGMMMAEMGHGLGVISVLNISEVS